MKAITIKQPFASLIVDGIKDIENRTWKTNFRGTVLIHAACKKPPKLPGDMISGLQYASLFTSNNIHLLQNTEVYGAIIGSVDIVDCVINHPSVWAEKTEGVLSGNTFYTKDETKTIYNWVLANPIRFAKPIENVKGKLSFWNYDPTPEKSNSEVEMKEAMPSEEFKKTITFDFAPTLQDTVTRIFNDIVSQRHEVIILEAFRRKGYDFPDKSYINLIKPHRLSSSDTDNVITYYLDCKPFLSKTTVTTVTDYDDTPHKRNVHIIYSFL